MLTVLVSGAVGLSAAGEPDPDRNLLPQWHGTWHGRLENLPPRAGAAEVGVELEVGVGDDAADGCLTWRSRFVVAGETMQVKDYSMCRDEQGRFFFDEGGGLVLETSIYGDDIFSAFEARGVMLFSHNRLDGDRMVQDIFFARDTTAPVEGITSFKGSGLQRTMFERIRHGEESADGEEGGER
jgi:hypothetical protein